MYNYVITRVNPATVLKATFCTGVCLGGLIGILLGLAERDAIGLFGGIFLGFLGGLWSGLMGLVCSFLFNILAPHIGGIAVKLEPQNTAAAPQTEQEAQLSA